MTEKSKHKKSPTISVKDIDLLSAVIKKGPTGKLTIDDELWAAMQTSLFRQARKSPKPSDTFPFSIAGETDQAMLDIDNWYRRESLTEIQERIADLRKKIESFEKAKKRDIARRSAASGETVSVKLAVYKNLQSRDLIDPVPADVMLKQAYAVVSVLQVIQHTIDDICKKPRSIVYIRKLSQESPINLDINGVSSAFKVLRDELVPWRREHQKVIAELDQLEKLLDIQVKEAEVAEAKAAAETRSSEARKMNAETARILEEAKSLRLQNDEKRLEHQIQTLQTAMDIVHGYAPNLEPQEALAYAMRLFPAFETIVTLPIDFPELD